MGLYASGQWGTQEAQPQQLSDDQSRAAPREDKRVVQLTTNISLEPNDAHRLVVLCGPFDQNLKHLEKRLGVHIRSRGNHFQVSGPDQRVRAAGALLSQLYRETLERKVIEPDLVHLFLQESGSHALLAQPEGKSRATKAWSSAPAARRSSTRGRNRPTTPRPYASHDLNFRGIGPAGTGKTYLAVACAVEFLETNRVARIPAGAPGPWRPARTRLPGRATRPEDRPLFCGPCTTTLFETMGVERVKPRRLSATSSRFAPLAYMRGRTLNNAFIILDESQNTTVAQMKMFLTRIGFGSTAVVTGDITQIDLPAGQKSGLVNVRNVLRGVPGISFTHFGSRDVVRHPLVQKIVDAYAQQPDTSPGQGKQADRDAG